MSPAGHSVVCKHGGMPGILADSEGKVVYNSLALLQVLPPDLLLNHTISLTLNNNMIPETKNDSSSA